MCCAGVSTFANKYEDVDPLVSREMSLWFIAEFLNNFC